MTKDAKRLHKTLTKAQQAVWATAVKAGFKPVVVPDKKRKVLRSMTCTNAKCGKRAFVFKKGKIVFAVCSSEHITRLSK